MTFLQLLDLMMVNNYDTKADFFLDDSATYGYDFAIDSKFATVLVFAEEKAGQVVTLQIDTDDEEGTPVQVSTIAKLKALLTNASD